MIPRATYRIQFHAGFTFADAAGLADYLADLGISHLYASPITTAKTGSMHGYDVVDPTTINPALGGEDGFRAMAAALRGRGIGIILDIVPNHMGVGGDENAWWLDVLEQGPGSRYARFFDIDWQPTGQLLAPFLGLPYGEALASGALKLSDDGTAVIAHGTHRFPIRPEDRAEVAADPGAFANPDRLHDLLERQRYRLAWWRTAADEINWRRFFDITELAALRIEDQAVFDAVHALPLRLYSEGLIDGLRIDHVDGLADPPGYCRRLRAAMEAVRPGGYLVVEKILAADEALPTDWRTDGTSGYDFMNEVAALLHDPAGEAPLTQLWTEISGRPGDFHAEEHRARIETLDRTFPGQLDTVVTAFHAIAPRDLTQGMIRRALTAILLEFVAYRSYAGSESDNGERLRAAAARAVTAPGEDDLPARLAEWMLTRPEARDAARRFEQLSAPLAAKAVEDTAFYRYGRLLSRTDVGFDPARFSQPAAEFLGRVDARARDFPNAMLATATHDHKRGEDVRARLAVLSEVPDEWRTLVEGIDLAGTGIDAGDASMILQTIVGAWPMAGPPTSDFAERIGAWTTKALREAKLRSSWTAPDEAYERRAISAATQMIGAPAVGTFAQRIAPAGAMNGLMQAALRCTLPGVPDTYQGAEFWDLSLVDPDNRRPVDYAARRPVARWEEVGLDDWASGRIKQALIGHALGLRRAHPAMFEAPVTPLAVTGARAGNVVAFERRAGEQALVVVAPLRASAGVGERPIVKPDWWGDTSIKVGGEQRGVAALLGERPVHIAVL
ncbi:malto-oligosyltrehalose synthase [Sphingomonas spermidinifaciens]|uniref:Malto-oligosyltrehalose synthase n=1 Tax=Sphingomonas spermidinifaciens TaxID=1141889 RepID=A0A2A4B6D7_9SPHN|nr:malto-oligosyltrehalose synthase [Sphingomonas spermidinifaciens]PCD03495.1 malto-oligosyltrehalose synthase [Sphingomonas spermidinifaciens]